MSASLREQLAPLLRGTQKACVRKNRYPDKAQAERVADRRMREDDHPDHLSAYRCPHCDGWHLTHL